MQALPKNVSVFESIQLANNQQSLRNTLGQVSWALSNSSRIESQHTNTTNNMCIKYAPIVNREFCGKKYHTQTPQMCKFQYFLWLYPEKHTGKRRTFQLPTIRISLKFNSNQMKMISIPEQTKPPHLRIITFVSSYTYSCSDQTTQHLTQLTIVTSATTDMLKKGDFSNMTGVS